MGSSRRRAVPLVTPPQKPPADAAAQRIGLVHLDEIGWRENAALLAGVVRGCDDLRFDVVILNLHRDRIDGESFATFFQRKGVRGVVLTAGANGRRICAAIASEGVPAVVAGASFHGSRVNFVCCDTQLAARRAAEHLIHLGHTRIGVGLAAQSSMEADDCLDGARRAFAASGLTFDDQLVVTSAASLEGGESALLRFMRRPHPPTAIFFTDPLMTAGAIAKSESLKLKIPEDLSIVGMDDDGLRQTVRPRFTALCQNLEEIGFEAARWLTRRVNGHGPAGIQAVLPHVFEINETTARPAAIAVQGAGEGTETWTDTALLPPPLAKERQWNHTQPRRKKRKRD